MDLVGHGASPLIAQSSCCCKRTWPIYSTSPSFGICLRCPNSEGLKASCLFDENVLDIQAIVDKYVVEYYREKGTADSATVVLVGHSYGVPLALTAAQKWKETVNGLVLIAGGAPVPLMSNPGLLSMPPWFLACFTSCLRKGFEMKVYADLCNPKGSSGFDDIKVLTSEERADGYQFNAYTLWAAMAGQWWPEGGFRFYRQVQLPVLLLSGTEDHLVTLEEEMETHFAIRKSVIRRLPGSGHMCMLEDPGRVNQLIKDHIEISARAPHPTATITSQPNISRSLERYITDTEAMGDKRTTPLPSSERKRGWMENST
ncbi:hypothetical protein Aperf_G00000075792 [Anoplocephala perfoliata]